MIFEIEGVKQQTMNTKVISPKTHGILDYIVSGIQIAAPALIGMNSTAQRTYQSLGAGMALNNAFTDTPAGIKRKIPFKTHKKADLGLLLGFSLLTFADFIKKDKKALPFHLVFLGIALSQYLLTDFEDD